MGNHAADEGVTIGGGSGNFGEGGSTTIGGGFRNVALGTGSTVAGGANNTVTDWHGTVGGGQYNMVRNRYSVIAGGGGGMDFDSNSAGGYASSILGGQGNIADGDSSTVGGGSRNTASGTNATIPGGLLNEASGNYSLAAGRRAKAIGDGSFVWADGTDADFSSSVANRFNIRATNGIYAKMNNTTYGAYFDNDGNGDGIRTYASVSKGVNYGALYAINSGTSPAIYSYSSGGYAAYLNGPVYVAGYLTKAGGGFKIDHPLDPENKYLVHSFVESPDMMNVYNGNAVLDGRGEATVELPDYFEALKRDFRYQLTAIGAPGPNLYIAEEISGNTFQIAGGQPGTKVSWQVTGVRQDKFAEFNRLPVEEEKTLEDRGKYLHPQAFDKPLEMGIGHGSKEMIGETETGIR